MGVSCLDISKKSVWLDTVDQEHITIEVINKCTNTLAVKLNVIGLPEDELLYERSLILRGGETQAIEIVADKYYEELEVRLSSQAELNAIFRIKLR
ncbi:MAG: hypothetical protein QXK88_00160 [Desulfurococcaceae archaeon]